MCPSLPRVATLGDDLQCPSPVPTRVTCPEGDGVSKWISRLPSLIDMWGDRPCPLYPNKETYPLIIERLTSPLTPQHRYSLDPPTYSSFVVEPLITKQTDAPQHTSKASSVSSAYAHPFPTTPQLFGSRAIPPSDVSLYERHSKPDRSGLINGPSNLQPFLSSPLLPETRHHPNKIRFGQL